MKYLTASIFFVILIVASERKHFEKHLKQSFLPTGFLPEILSVGMKVKGGYMLILLVTLAGCISFFGYKSKKGIDNLISSKTYQEAYESILKLPLEFASSCLLLGFFSVPVLWEKVYMIDIENQAKVLLTLVGVITAMFFAFSLFFFGGLIMSFKAWNKILIWRARKRRSLLKAI